VNEHSDARPLQALPRTSKRRFLFLIKLRPVLGYKQTCLPEKLTAVFDAVDGSTAGIAMCHGGSIEAWVAIQRERSVI
jgi:hypothetical protein